MFYNQIISPKKEHISVPQVNCKLLENKNEEEKVPTEKSTGRQNLVLETTSISMILPLWEQNYYLLTDLQNLYVTCEENNTD